MVLESLNAYVDVTEENIAFWNTYPGRITLPNGFKLTSAYVSALQRNEPVDGLRAPAPIRKEISAVAYEIAVILTSYCIETQKKIMSVVHEHRKMFYEAASDSYIYLLVKRILLSLWSVVDVSMCTGDNVYLHPRLLNQRLNLPTNDRPRCFAVMEQLGLGKLLRNVALAGNQRGERFMVYTSPWENGADSDVCVSHLGLTHDQFKQCFVRPLDFMASHVDPISSQTSIGTTSEVSDLTD